MIAEIAAVKALLDAVGTVYEVDATGVESYPYMILWASPTGTPSIERPVTGLAVDFDDTFGVTSVGLSAEAVRIVAKAARDALCPNGLPTKVAVTGRDVTIEPAESRQMQVDKNVTLRDGSHPLYAVDTYRIVSIAA